MTTLPAKGPPFIGTRIGPAKGTRRIWSHKRYPRPLPGLAQGRSTPDAPPSVSATGAHGVPAVAGERASQTIVRQDGCVFGVSISLCRRFFACASVLLLPCCSCVVVIVSIHSSIPNPLSLWTKNDDISTTIVCSSCETSAPAINRTLDDVPPEHLKDQQSPPTRCISSSRSSALHSLSPTSSSSSSSSLTHSALPPSFIHSFIQQSAHGRFLRRRRSTRACCDCLFCRPKSSTDPCARPPLTTAPFTTIFLLQHSPKHTKGIASRSF